MRGLVYFRNFETLHRDKDIGSLAYYLDKNPSVTSCKMVTNFPSKDPTVPGLRLWELFRNIKASDFLILYHFTIETLIISCISKLLFRKTKIIIKSDLDTRYLEYLDQSSRRYVFKFIVYITNLILVETDTYHKQILQYSQQHSKFFTLYNGSKLISLPKKTTQRVTDVLIVGRWGLEQKNTPFILKALLRYPKISGLQNITIIGDPSGPNEVENRDLVNSLQEKYQIDVKTHISNNQLLADEYLKARILLSPSLYESFCLVIAEAVLLGVKVISHDVGIAADLKKVTKGVSITSFLNETDWVEKICEGLSNDKPVSVPAVLEAEFNWQKLSTRLINRVTTC